MGVKKKAKTDSTFSKHQSCNERIIKWLYEKHPEAVDTGLRQELDDLVAEMDYSGVESQFPKYRKNGGKKSLDQRKDHLLVHNQDASFISLLCSILYLALNCSTT